MGGRIPVTFLETKSGLFGEMLQPKPTFGQQHPRDVIAKLAGVEAQDLVHNVPVQTVSTGRPKIIETQDSAARIHARNILSWTEDPVTGSAGGACIAWMVKHGGRNRASA